MLDLIYLNYNSTTPIDDRVRTSMLPYLNQEFGNEASDAHIYARQSDNVLKSSKEKIAKFLGCEPEEIYFTSGSKESINFIFKSIEFFFTLLIGCLTIKIAIVRFVLTMKVIMNNKPN